MAKDILITPASSIIEFKDAGTQVASIYESSGDLFLGSVNGSVLINGAVTLGDGLASNLEIGGDGTVVTMNFLGGGDLTSSGNALNIGLAGDVVNLNTAGVTYNFPSSLVTFSDYTDNDILTRIKNVDGAGSGLDADLLDGMASASSNTVSTIVARDASGNFSAGKASLTALQIGTSTTANYVLKADASGNATWGPVVTSISAGTTGLSVNASTGDVTLSGVLVTANGGTGINAYAAGDMLYYSSGTTLTRMLIAGAGKVVRSTGSAPTWSNTTWPDSVQANQLLYAATLNNISGLTSANTAALVTNSSGVPSFTSGTTANRVLRTDGTTIGFAQVALGTDVSGTLPISNGGTGTTTAPTKGGVIYASATTSYASTSAGTTGQVLISNAANAPSWVTLDLTYLPDSAFKKSVKAASTADIGASAQTSTTLTGYSATVTLACTTDGTTTVTTTSTAGLKIGAVISTATIALPAGTTVATITNATTFTITPRPTITTTAITCSGTTATATFTAQTYIPFAVGGKITVSGAVPTGYNGTFTVTNCTTTSVSFTVASTQVTATTQGTIAGFITSGSAISTIFTQTIGALVIDGITLALNDRVLIKDQTTIGSISVTAGRDNGIYYLSTLGTTSVPWVLTRALSADSSTEIAGGTVNVDSGATNGGFLFSNNFKTTDTLGTTAMPWYRLYSTFDSSTASTANKLVIRDSSGNFTAGTITASLSGNASTASNISNTGTVTLATATESNAITITAPSYSDNLPVKLLNFNWYTDAWSLGNIRSGSTPSNGLGVYLNSVEKYRFADGTLTIAGAATIKGASSLTLDSSSTGAVNIGTSANGKTITIGNSTSGTSVTITTANGITLTGATSVSSNLTVNSKVYLRTVDSQGSGAHGISWYSPAYYTWYDYMASSGATYAPNGLATPTYGDVTSWARRSNIENTSGFGWIWEAGPNNTTTAPTGVMSLGSATGNLKVSGRVATTGIRASNDTDNIILTGVTSAVNQITVTNAATGNGPQIAATGSDTNVSLNILSKGTGLITLDGNTVISTGHTLSTPNNQMGIKLGDDSQIGDVNVTNMMGLQGQQDATMGGIVFGSGKDTNLYRSTADTLKTDDNLYVSKVLTAGNSGTANNLIIMKLSGQTWNFAELTDSKDLILMVGDANHGKFKVTDQMGIRVMTVDTDTQTVDTEKVSVANKFKFQYNSSKDALDLVYIG